MQFSRGRSRRALNEWNPTPLQFYQEPPTENISLGEFETLAVERLKLLKSIENIGVNYLKTSDQYSKKLDAELRKQRFYFRTSVEDKHDDNEVRRKDHLSHFILRLAYCQTEDLRRWFIQQELDLFRFRFSELSSEKQQQFLKHNDLDYKVIDEKEKDAVHDDVMKGSKLSSIKMEKMLIYKIRFTDALELIRGRKVFLKRMYAYVPQPEIVIIVLNEFRQKLSKDLALTKRSLHVIESDERLQPLLNHLSHAYVGQNYSIQKNVGKISLEQIDGLAAKSYPLCMRQLHKALRDNHHLRHGGRMQYGLFLKGIGVTLEQALQFWRSEFIKGKVDAEKFDKLYSYNIRHSFGKEGKRTDYTPYSCMKIILSNPPSQGDYHGCPFRHSDPELLKQKLQSYKISSAGITQILDLVKGMHYQLACQKYFELTHNVEEVGFSHSHPNQYFIESQKLLHGGQDVKKEPNPPESSQRSQHSQPARPANTSAPKPADQQTSEELEMIFSDG